MTGPTTSRTGRRWRSGVLAPRAGAILLALEIAVAVSGCGPTEPERPPNIVFILTDDHRFDAMGCAGQPQLETEHLDRLADEGIRFTDAFVVTSLCSPSRASFLTGCYPHRHGVVANEVCDPLPEVATFPQLLQQAGYRTAFIGKWHMLRRATPRAGFDYWIGFTSQGEYFRNTYWANGEWRLSYEYVTDELTQYAENFIVGQTGDPPFLLIVSHKAVHEPFLPAPRHRHRYVDAEFAGGHDPRDDLDSKPVLGGRDLRGDREHMIREYHRCLLAVDESVGRILAALEARGILDETVIVYAGDNGYLHGEHGGLWDKRVAYEPSLRIPLLMRYPPLWSSGRTSAALALNIDLAPTLLELAGVPIPSSVQGRSLTGVLRGEPGRDAFFYEYFQEIGSVPTCLAVRSRDWKYVTYPDDPQLTEELYDLQADPGELFNLRHDARYAPELQRLRDRLVQLQRETGFRRPSPNRAGSRPVGP